MHLCCHIRLTHACGEDVCNALHTSSPNRLSNGSHVKVPPLLLRIDTEYHLGINDVTERACKDRHICIGGLDRNAIMSIGCGMASMK